VNGKKVLSLMRQENILCKRKSFKPKTTNSNHTLPLYPNLTQDVVVTRPNQLWVADITYVHFQDGVAYLATILDLFGRKCVGWELSRHIDAALCLGALDKAIAQREPIGLKGLIHHSDRGVQYASHMYVDRLTTHDMLISMTQTGNPRENAFAESFFKTIKVEEVYLKEYETFEDAYRNIQRFIEDVYNAKRLHSSIGYKTPNEMEAEVLNNS
jgi:transposase InsO family protein